MGAKNWHPNVEDVKPIIHGATLLHATCCTKLNGCQLGATCCMQQNKVSYTVQHVACNNVAPCMIGLRDNNDSFTYMYRYPSLHFLLLNCCTCMTLQSVTL